MGFTGHFVVATNLNGGALFVAGVPRRIEAIIINNQTYQFKQEKTEQQIRLIFEKLCVLIF